MAIWLRWRTPCANWPCKRCDRAGRTFGRVREEWHRNRRRQAVSYLASVVLTLAGVAVLATVAQINVVAAAFAIAAIVIALFSTGAGAIRRPIARQFGNGWAAVAVVGVGAVAFGLLVAVGVWAL